MGLAQKKQCGGGLLSEVHRDNVVSAPPWESHMNAVIVHSPRHFSSVVHNRNGKLKGEVKRGLIWK